MENFFRKFDGGEFGRLLEILESLEDLWIGARIGFTARRCSVEFFGSACFRFIKYLH